MKPITKTDATRKAQKPTKPHGITPRTGGRFVRDQKSGEVAPLVEAADDTAPPAAEPAATSTKAKGGASK